MLSILRALLKINGRYALSPKIQKAVHEHADVIRAPQGDDELRT